MSESKFVKAYCTKTNQYYALEVKKFGATWKVVNMTYLDADEAKFISSEVEQGEFQTNPTLLACTKCGNRKVGGCSCSPQNHACSVGMKYQFDCIYCDKVRIDYSVPTASDVGGRAGEKITLSQGQEVKIRFTDDKPMNQIYVGVGWDPANGSVNMDVDSSVVVVSPDNSQKDLVYFGEKEHESGCVIHHGDNLTGDSTTQGDDENISVYLNRVPQNRDKLVFVLNIYKCDERYQTLDSVKNLYIRLCDPESRKTLIEYKVQGNCGTDTAIVIGVATRRGGAWSFKAVGRSLRCASVRELAERCTNYL